VEKASRGQACSSSGGFRPSGIVGAQINAWFQEAPWERQKQFELLRHELDEGFSLIDELGTLIGERFFGLQRVVWASESQQPLQIEDTWDEYYAVVLQWNRRLIVNRARILRIFGADEARRFLNYSDENQPSLPQSVHGHFRKAHEAVLSLSQCVQTRCKDESRLLNASRQALNDLDILTDEYVERLAATLVSQAESMKLR